MAERTAVEALAEALFRSHEADFVSSAQRLVDDLAARGFRLVPEVPTPWMRDCLRTWLGREFTVFPSDRMLDAVCRDMLQVQAAPGAKEEGEEA